MSKYENCQVGVYGVTYYLIDENGDEILNEDGTTKLFKDKRFCCEEKTRAEWVEPENLEEVDDE